MWRTVSWHVVHSRQPLRHPARRPARRPCTSSMTSSLPPSKMLLPDARAPHVAHLHSQRQENASGQPPSMTSSSRFCVGSPHVANGQLVRRPFTSAITSAITSACTSACTSSRTSSCTSSMPTSKMLLPDPRAPHVAHLHSQCQKVTSN